MPYSSTQLFFDSLRPSRESQLLSEFAEIQKEESVLEIGCGNGFISIYLACHFPEMKGILGIDLEKKKILEAIGAYTFIHTKKKKAIAPAWFEIQDTRNPFRATFQLQPPFDVIVCNPPFFSQRNSRLSPNPSRRAARQDTKLTLNELFAAARQFLKPQGRFYIVFPSSRTEEIHALCNKEGFDEILIKPFPDIRKSSGGISLFFLQAQNFFEISNGS